MNEPPIRSSRSIGSLRFLAWILPSCVIPVLLFLPILLTGFLGLPSPFPRGLSWIGAIVALFYLARFDAMLQCQQRQIPQDDPRAKIGKRMATFVLLQIMLVPLLWFSVTLAFCAISGNSFR